MMQGRPICHTLPVMRVKFVRGVCGKFCGSPWISVVNFAANETPHVPREVYCPRNTAPYARALPPFWTKQRGRNPPTSKQSKVTTTVKSHDQSNGAEELRKIARRCSKSRNCRKFVKITTLRNTASTCGPPSAPTHPPLLSRTEARHSHPTFLRKELGRTELQRRGSHWLLLARPPISPNKRPQLSLSTSAPDMKDAKLSRP